MEACNAVEREVERVISKFSGINEHTERLTSDLVNHIEALKNEINECNFILIFPVFHPLFMFIVVFWKISGPDGHELTPGQILIMKQTLNKVKETAQRLATEHRDLHSTVSKVGKAIDRVSCNLLFSFTVLSDCS